MLARKDIEILRKGSLGARDLTSKPLTANQSTSGGSRQAQEMAAPAGRQVTGGSGSIRFLKKTTQGVEPID